MSSIIKILYDGEDAFYPQPTPLIQLDEESIYINELWGRGEGINIIGQLTGCSFESIVDAQYNILNKFNKPFQSLQIWQIDGANSGIVFQKDLIEIQSINFDQNRWFGVLPYTISLSCYPSGLFSGYFGILEPSDIWEFNEESNENLVATHSISCQPFNTSSGPSNALSNARNWAFGRSGLNSTIYPLLISGININTFCLISQNETIDRFNGTYSLIETYINDLARTGYGLVRYTTDINSGNNIISVNLNGVVRGAFQNIDSSRQAFSQINWVAVANKEYNSVFNRNDLNPIPLTQNINEDPFEAEITFNYSFDNSNLPSVWFDYTVDLQVGTNGLITANINGTVYARGGDTASKLSRTLAYSSGINLYNLVLPFYNSFDASSIIPLNSVPISDGKAINQTDGTVDLNATFNNRNSTINVLDIFDANIEVIPSLAQVDAKPVLDGLGTYSIVNLKYGSRAQISIQGSALVNNNYSSNDGIAAVKNAAYNLFLQYGRKTKATLDEDITTTNRTDGRVINFSYIWSFGPVNIVGPTSIGSLIV